MYAYYSRLEASERRLKLYELPPNAYVAGIVNGGDSIIGRGRHIQSNQQNNFCSKGKGKKLDVLCAFGL